MGGTFVHCGNKIQQPKSQQTTQCKSMLEIENSDVTWIVFFFLILCQIFSSFSCMRAPSLITAILITMDRLSKIELPLGDFYQYWWKEKMGQLLIAVRFHILFFRGQFEVERSNRIGCVGQIIHFSLSPVLMIPPWLLYWKKGIAIEYKVVT